MLLRGVEMAKTKLTPKQAKFCQEYIIDFNGARAADKAGWSKKTARATASRLLTYCNIQEYITELLEKRSKRTEVTADQVVTELAKLAFSNMGDFVDVRAGSVSIKEFSDLTRDQLACIAEVSETVTKDGGSVRFKLHDKTKNLELLGRHLAMFTDKHDHTTGGEPLAAPVINVSVGKSDG